MRCGVPRLEAIVDAGRKRARPIAMTTIAMIGGLLSSTPLSLLFVPAVFSAMDDVAGMIWGYFRRYVGEADEPARSTPRRTGPPKAQGLPIVAE
jgi:hypothetical protein